jgi:hypothetical protein
MRMRAAVLASLIALIADSAFAQGNLRRLGDWKPSSEKGCIGGDLCRTKSLRVPLDDRPVIAVRFHAHDQVGERAEGVIRVKIDGNVIESSLDIPRRGETFTIDVEELYGRSLTFEPVNDDEVEIREIAVLYAQAPVRRPPRDSAGWRAYPRAGGCIGGDDCQRNGDRITVALENAPVLGVRFSAHDGIGQRADGKISVRIDGHTVASWVDVQRAGKRHEFDLDSVTGSKLVIETVSDDEVEISGLEILYGRATRPRQSFDEVRHEGGCIGGSECGGRRARVRIALNGRPVASIRLYARDDVGTRAGGELRIRIDDETLEWALDIPREGRTFTINGNEVAGDYLYLEPATDDEIVLRDIRVIFAD